MLTPRLAITYIAETAIRSLCYEEGSVWRDCPVLTTNGKDHWEKISLGIYSSPFHRGVPQDCFIGAHIIDTIDIKPGFQLLEDSGAAVQIVFRKTDWFWRPYPEASSDGPYPLIELKKVIQREKTRFLPENIRKIKTYRQKYLFDRIFPITHRKLIEVFERACLEGRHQLTKVQTKKQNCFNDLCALALRILCLQILDHRGLLGGSPKSSITDRQVSAKNFADLQSKARQLPTHLKGIKEYISHDSLARLGQDVASAIFATLKSDSEYDFASITPDMLGPFYQRALLGDEETAEMARKKHGIFYTSRRITQLVLDRLPIEEIPPEKRFLLDPTCGSGSFLMAGEQRLLELARPRGKTGEEKATQVSRLIQGNDNDNFALEVAQLGLALDHPEILSGYRFKSIEIDTNMSGYPYYDKPSIIVGNPPFLRRHKKERAAEFLRIFVQDLLQDSGLLGLIMPATFLSDRACRDVREYLNKTCKILEIWDLPRNILSNPAYEKDSNGDSAGGDIETCAIFLQKNSLPITAVSFSRVFHVSGRSEHKNHFRYTGVPTTQGTITSPNSSSFGSQYWASLPTADILERLIHSNKYYPLKSICEVANGIKRSPEEPINISGKLTKETLVPWLQSAQGMNSYTVNKYVPEKTTVYIDYPGQMQNPRIKWAKIDFVTGKQLPDNLWLSKGIFAGKKFLIHRTVDPATPRRVKCFVDIGHYPSDNFYFAWINPNLTSKWAYEDLLAIINGPIAQAWIQMAGTRSIPVEMLKLIPIPKINKQQHKLLSQKVREVIKSRNISDKYQEKLESLEKIVLDLYSLSNFEKKTILNALSNIPKPDWDLVWVDDEPWPIHGVVKHITKSTDKDNVWIEIKIPGFKQGLQKYNGPVPAEMPGWALRPGIEFQAEIPWSDGEANRFDPGKIRRFRPLPYAYERQNGKKKTLQVRGKGVDSNCNQQS